MPTWTAERTVDDELAARLVAEQFAPLPRRSLVRLAEGWDYAVYAVDGTWAFRFPRRQVVVPGTEREIAVLPRIAPALPVAVPEPELVGRPSAAFPWPFYGAALLPGVEVADAALDDARRTALARPLARALRRLHAPDLLAGVGAELPDDPMGRGDPGRRVPLARERLSALAEAGIWQAPPPVDALLEEALGLPPPEPSAVCHGDLHFRQLLVDQGEPSGIVDWVDLCRGDPGVDLQLYWSLLPPAARAEFLDEYGPVPESSLLRARVLALDLNAVLALYGREEGLGRVAAEALLALERAVAGL